MGVYFGFGNLKGSSLSSKERCTIAMNSDYDYGAFDGNVLSYCSYSYSSVEFVIGYKYHFHEIRFKKSRWKGSFYLGLGLNPLLMRETYSHLVKEINSPIYGHREAYLSSGKIDYLIFRATQCMGVSFLLKNKWEFTIEPTSAYSKPFDLKYKRFNYFQSSPFVSSNLGLRVGVGVRF